MKDQVTRLCGWLTALFSSEADRVARESGFAGAEFVRTLVFGWMDDKHATIADFAEQLDVTPSAVQQRLTARCVDMFATLLENACALKRLRVKTPAR